MKFENLEKYLFKPVTKGIFLIGTAATITLTSLFLPACAPAPPPEPTRIVEIVKEVQPALSNYTLSDREKKIEEIDTGRYHEKNNYILVNRRSKEHDNWIIYPNPPVELLDVAFQELIYPISEKSLLLTSTYCNDRKLVILDDGTTIPDNLKKLLEIYRKSPIGYLNNILITSENREGKFEDVIGNYLQEIDRTSLLVSPDFQMIRKFSCGYSEELVFKASGSIDYKNCKDTLCKNTLCRDTVQAIEIYKKESNGDWTLIGSGTSPFTFYANSATLKKTGEVELKVRAFPYNEPCLDTNFYFTRILETCPSGGGGGGGGGGGNCGTGPGGSHGH